MSITSEDRNESERPNQEVKDLNPEPSTQPPHAAAEAALPSPQREEEEESSARPVQSPGSCGED